MKFAFWVGALLLSSGMGSAQAKTVRYELTATRGTVNLSGKAEVDFALKLNDSIPAPTLEFTEGDVAEIVVKNEIPGEELSIHWHGILLPSEMDGVPYVTTPPILSGGSFIYRFRLRQHGTYWYHSHTNVQEQKGLYGAFIVQPKGEAVAADREAVVVISDWSDENATDILKNLRKDGDYYLYKKGTMRSWAGAIGAGSLGNFLYNEWTRMGGMDYSDVGYDAFLINGKVDSQLLAAHPGEKVRLRLINASASTYFQVSLGRAPMKVISADGIDIDPKWAREILIGVAETYDVLFTVPEHKNYELRATAQDGTGAASGWIGMGEKVAVPVRASLALYSTMDHSAGHGEHSAHGGHAAIPAEKPDGVIDTLTVDSFRAKSRTAFSPTVRVHDVKLVLGGDMERYVWHINGRAIHQDRTIEVEEGDVVRFTFINQTMMHHPMHLHGHFFRVLNGEGDHSPLKHTVDVSPHTERTIEFLANEPGEWMLHCHNLYHLKTGMARVVKYSSFKPKAEMAYLQKHDPHLHDHWYFYGFLEASSNHARAYVRASQTWNQLEFRVESANIAGKHFSLADRWDYEGDLLYRRWFSQFLNLAGGVTTFGGEIGAVAGFAYTLPMLVKAQVLVSHRAQFRLDIEKRFQWTKAVFSEVDLSWRPAQQGAHEFEYEISLMYGPSWHWSAGLMLTNDSLGGGIQVQF